MAPRPPPCSRRPRPPAPSLPRPPSLQGAMAPLPGRSLTSLPLSPQGATGERPALHRRSAQGVTLYCTAVLHCTVLYCSTLYTVQLYGTVLHCTTLHCIALHCTVLHCTAHCTALYYTPTHCCARHLNYSLQSRGQNYYVETGLGSSRWLHLGKLIMSYIRVQDTNIGSHVQV